MALHSVEIYFKSNVMEPKLFTSDDDGGCQLYCSIQGSHFIVHKKRGLVEEGIPYSLKLINRIITTEHPPKVPEQPMVLRDL